MRLNLVVDCLMTGAVTLHFPARYNQVVAVISISLMGARKVLHKFTEVLII
jgi:hypothetical protein